MSRLDRLLDPQTIAVIGGSPAARAVRESDRLGFVGDIWPVHPTKTTVGGRRAYASLADLPGAPDAAFVAINRQATILAVHELAAMGAGGAILYASGFAEAGEEGAALQRDLVSGHDMPVIGPNCYGTINATSGAVMWPDVHGCRRVEKGPAFISQSGNIALNVTMNRRGVDFSHVLSVGNQASVTVEECIKRFAADPNVTSIGVYLESIEDSRAFGRAALQAKDHRTPIVLLKTGRSKNSEQIAASHTAAIVSSSDAYDALFSRYGIVTVDTLPEMMTTLSLLDTIGPLPGNRLVCLSSSGGEASIVADRATLHDVRFDPFSEAHRSRIHTTVSDLVTINNPLDYHTFIWADRGALNRCFTAVLDGPADAAMFVLDWPDDSNDDSDWWPTLEAIEAASEGTGTRAIVATSLPENLPDRVRARLQGGGVGTASTIDEALFGLDACASVGRWFEGESPEIHLGPGWFGGETVTVGEVESKAILADAGVSVPLGAIVTTDDPPLDLTYPLVAKVVGVSHKTESDGVIMGIADDEALGRALRCLRESSPAVLLEEMVTDRVAEVLVSIRREPSIGIVAVIGAGGTMTELIIDSTTILLPTIHRDIERAVRAMRIGALLEGFRGGNSGDIISIAKTVDALSSILADREDIAEIEINPLIVTPTRAVAVDALITMGKPW